MPQNFNKYFSSSSSERKGMFVLVSLLMLLLVFFFASNYFFVSKPLKISIKEVSGVKEIKNSLSAYKEKLDKKQTELFQFDPNKINKAEWMKLGFSIKQANSIINFKKSGFKFKEKEDLKKLFVVDEIKYKQLESYVIIPKRKKTKEKECYRVLLASNDNPIYNGFEIFEQVFYKKEEEVYKYYSNSFENWKTANGYLMSIESKGYEGAFITKLPCSFQCYPIKIKSHDKQKVQKFKREVVNLNSADTNSIKSLIGIGSYYAKKIVEYRSKLGGFYNVNQLKEVYGLQPELVENNEDYIVIDSNLVIKININKTNSEELKKHPYISWRVANSIVMYRANHGAYKSVQNIQNSDLVNEELYRKIARYLTIE